MAQRERTRVAFPLLAVLWMATSWITGCAGAPDAPAATRPHADPGEVCATGCSAAPNGGSELTRERYRELIVICADPEASEEAATSALEELLFHGEQTQAWVTELGVGALDADSTRRLAAELARNRVRFDVRLLAEDGAELLRLGERSIPIGHKQHIWPRRALGFEPPEVSGTIQRVGVNHLWARL